jgi:hypothetical protein
LSLEPAAGIPDDRGLTVDVARAEVETALGSSQDGIAELLLELETRGADGETSRHTVVLDCTTADLDRLLSGGDDNVIIRFDAESLGRAIDTTDVEAHGLREKMAVVAMVVATTGAAAGAAQAMPALGGHGYPAGAAVAGPSAAAAGTTGAPAPRADPALAAEATMAQSDWGGQTSSGQTGPYSGGAPFQAHHDTGTPFQANQEGQLGPYAGGAPFQGTQTGSPARDLPSDSLKASQARPVAHGAVSATVSDSSSIDSTAVVIAGGIVMTLIGVGFAAAATTRRTPRPT